MSRLIKKNSLSPRAYIQYIVEEAEAGRISRSEAVNYISIQQVEYLLHDQLKPKLEEIQDRIVSKGINVSPGASTGKIFFNLGRARSLHKEKNTPIIWVCVDLKPDEVDNIVFSDGWIVGHGGSTSHVAVVARQKGIPCITGIKDIKIHEIDRKISIGSYKFSEGDWITIDGGIGAVIDGRLEIVPENIDDEVYLHKILKWADEFRVLKVYANADTPEDVKQAKRFGAEGVGVCRTEHMFLNNDILPLIQQLIISYQVGEHLVLPSKKIENFLIEHLLPLQRNAFYRIFKNMPRTPIIIRLLDMPLDEFISDAELFVQNAQNNNFYKKYLSEEQISEILNCIHEINPMLGFRGVRLGVLRPAIYEMQVQAIIEAGCKIIKENGNDTESVLPKIMIPLVSYSEEVKITKKLVDTVAYRVMKEQNCKVNYQFGAMIETPQSAFIADEIAKYVHFFSFGTNDLTQTTMGISRDDAERKFLLDYIQKGIIKVNPFQTLDTNGLVGHLIKLAVKNGKSQRIEKGEHLEVGICGEHGGDENSIVFCHDIKLDYISCSSNRVFLARLSAAHAALINT